MSANLEELHKKCSKLTSDDLIMLILQLQMQDTDEKLLKIMKTYLYRALFKEGFR